MDRTDFNKRAWKAGVWYVISVIFVRGISFFATPFLSRLLTKEQYGILTVYDSWLRILFPILTLSFYASVERAKYEFEEEYDAYIASIQLAMTGACLAAAAGIFFLHRQIGKILNMTDIMLVIMVFYVWAQSAINSFQRREKLLLRYWQNIVITACATVLPTILSISVLFWYKGIGNEDELLYVRIFSFYIPQILVGMAVAVLLFRRGHVCFSKKYIKFAVEFSFPLIPHVLSMEILNQSDKIMVGRLAGDEKAGVYSLGVTVMWIILLVSQAVGDAWMPWLYDKLKRREFIPVGETWKEMIRLFGMFGWLVVVFAPEIVWIFGGSFYAEAVYLVPPLTIGVMAHFFSYSYISAEQFYKRTFYVMAVSVAAVLLNLLLNYAGILIFGYTAAAFATAFCYTFMMIAHAFLLKIKFGNCFMPAKVTIAVFLFFSILDLITMNSYQSAFWVRCLMAVSGTGIYLAVSFHSIKGWAERWKSEHK